MLKLISLQISKRLIQFYTKNRYFFTAEVAAFKKWDLSAIVFCFNLKQSKVSFLNINHGSQLLLLSLRLCGCVIMREKWYFFFSLYRGVSKCALFPVFLHHFFNIPRKIREIAAIFFHQNKLKVSWVATALCSFLLLFKTGVNHNRIIPFGSCGGRVRYLIWGVCYTLDEQLKNISCPIFRYNN